MEAVVTISISDATRDVLEQVEHRSGKPVEVLTDPALPTLATIRMAKSSAPAHILVYNPNGPGVNYHVAYQCGFVLRLFDTPPDQRFEFGGTTSGREAVRKLLTEKGGVAKKLRLPKAAVSNLSDQFFDGLMTQLRSYPIGMRIDQWIRETYPDLRDAQEASVDRQQRDNAQVLNPQVKQMTPPLIFTGNASMNAAYALFCERLLGTSQYTVAYRSIGLEERGRVLLDLWDGVPSGARHDYDLVNAWGEELGVSTWYKWVPFDGGGS